MSGPPHPKNQHLRKNVAIVASSVFAVYFRTATDVRRRPPADRIDEVVARGWLLSKSPSHQFGRGHCELGECRRPSNSPLIIHTSGKIMYIFQFNTCVPLFLTRICIRICVGRANRTRHFGMFLLCPLPQQFLSLIHSYYIIFGFDWSTAVLCMNYMVGPFSFQFVAVKSTAVYNRPNAHWFHLLR